MAVAIVLAAGAGVRMGAGHPKGFRRIGSRTIVETALTAALDAAAIDAAVVTVPESLEAEAQRLLGGAESGSPVTIVVGGETRQDSVRLALEAVDVSVETVAVHDAARCFASPALFDAVLTAVGADDVAGAIPVVAISDTVKRTRDGVVVETLDREELFLAQTPQAFSTAVLRRVHERAESQGVTATDDAALLEWAGERVVVVRGEARNTKITTAADLAAAQREAVGDGGGDRG
jgi:2-C-methyl-D-erythritol 4-phosphate cytidylyltransferase/2-C-methyl-D-erythritol 2,4-cyclodiphosphate synthase